MEKVKVSVLQLSASESKEESIRKFLKLAERSTGKILVLPEYAMLDPTDLDPTKLYEVSETLDNGEWINTLREMAKSKEACIIGTMFEKSNKPPLVYNTAVLIDDQGEIIEKYRKTHLFDVLGFKESSKIHYGEQLFSPVDFCGVRIGLAICFEIRYPELFRLQAERGVDAFFIPSAWYTGHGKEETYRILAQARAHENVAYVIGSILYGDHFTGRSLVVNPFGIVVAEAGFGERILETVLDPEELENAKELLPLLALRRTDLYRLKTKE